MTVYQAIGYELKASSALSAIVSTRIYHGIRPQGTVLPALNFYQLGGLRRSNGFERGVFSINCRADTSKVALQLFNIVLTMFEGEAGNGMKGSISTFTVISSSLQGTGGLLFEEDQNVYNAPVDIQVVYPVTTAT